MSSVLTKGHRKDQKGGYDENICSLRTKHTLGLFLTFNSCRPYRFTLHVVKVMERVGAASNNWVNIFLCARTIRARPGTEEP